jgi:histidinol-phosphate aminotransferase
MDQDYLKEITRKNAKEREKFYNIEQSKHFLPSQTKYNACGLSVTTNTKFV